MRKLGFFLLIASAMSVAQPDHKMTKADVDRWMTELSNWGRWGKDDQLGTLNLITPAKRKEAAALVKEGYSISMAHIVLTEKAVDNENPFVHTMLPTPGGFHMDNYSVSFHGMGQTHLDALCHASYQGKMYNGVSVDTVAAEGCPQDSVLPVKTGILTRGVIIDIARLKGVEYLEPGTPIYPEDLAAWEKQTGVKVSAGDAVFVRTGVWARRKALGPWLRGRAEGGRDAGLDPSVIPWLKKRDIAIMGSDHPQYVSPSNLRGAVHDFALLYLGVHLFDNCDLEALADAAAARRRWEFLLTAAPLPIRGGTGSPANPIATF